MAGRVLRDSKGRFNGSTKGWRKKRAGAEPSARRTMSRRTKRIIGLGVVAAAGIGAGLYVNKNGFSKAIGISKNDGGMIRGLRLGKATAYMVTETRKMAAGVNNTQDWRLKRRSFSLNLRTKEGNRQLAGIKLEKVLRPKGVKARGHWRVVS